ELVLDAVGSFPPVLVDRERFSDEVVGVLAGMAAAGAREIRLVLRREEDTAGLLIEASVPLSPRRIRFYRRKFGLSGAALAVSGDGAGLFLLFKPASS
ncbi:MAG: hypothetical protein WCY70_07200, partial [Methanoculleus sp.]